MMVQVSRYYEVITPESAEQGDAEERGEVYTGREMSIRDVVREIRDNTRGEPPTCMLATTENCI